jgi:Protein-L-isoaspartate carboxylmethyltransferase
LFSGADGRRGYPDAAPYDVIYISQAIRDIPWHVSKLYKYK